MKNLIRLFVCLCSCLGLFCISAYAQGTGLALPKIDVKTGIGIALAAWEVLARFLPTNKNYTLIKKVVDVLRFVEQVTHVEKKTAPARFPSALKTLIVVFGLGALLVGCKSEFECVHQSYKPVVVILPDSSTQVIQVPFCDTVRIKRKATVDTSTTAAPVTL